jgi:hypothetical protein
MRHHCLVFSFVLIIAGAAIADEATNQLSREETESGFELLFNGKDLTGWQGDLKGYIVAEPGVLLCRGGGLYTEKDYGDFILRFEFKLPPNGNNGIGLRAPLGQDAAYHGMESQILDDSGSMYTQLKPWQYHGSIYGVVPATRGSLKPVGQWNAEEILCDGPHVRVTVNGQVIVDADLSAIKKPMDGRQHPGLKRAKGSIGLLGHGSPVQFRNIRVKELD